MTTTEVSVTVKFFALVREQTGVAELREQWFENDTVESLKQRLIDKGKGFELALSGPLVMACNQTIVGGEHPIQHGDEIAFFPPVTGG